ncbi:nuclear transport factor 2 family protein [Microbacterium sp. dk485]|uniref:nuclear transport factor 2 family protein n=1 Tax=Microbacterium TaxID=33882 RepID=UPI0010730262|nr:MULTISPECIES: nuclear transport factor 2 family protein [Microbacterium]TFV84114.1 nuclear transport factor 2 family protein [Microbacterium sp. dk485]TXK16074.1 nuclear transport factor 2 family protein [Microbacterium wangchenii]
MISDDKFGVRQGSALASDLGLLEAVRAVKRLQHTWGHYADAADFSAMADLFSTNGRLILGDERADGREAIRLLLVSAMGQGAPEPRPDRLNVRLLMSPVVTVAADGRTARGRWHELALIGRQGVHATWSGGIQENEYVREDGVWKIRQIHHHPQFAGEHREGWHSVNEAVPLVPFHFTPDEAGTIIRKGNAAGAGQAPEPTETAARVRALRAETAVRNLLSAYGHYADRKLWDDIVDLFSEDGTLERDQQRWSGAAEIRRGLEGCSPAGLQHGELHDHLELMPVVTVTPDGAGARVRAMELQLSARHGEFARWSVSVCDGEFYEADGRWRIRSMVFRTRLLADHAHGWMNLPDEGPTTAYPHGTAPAVTFAHPVLHAAVAPLEAAGVAPAEVRRQMAVERAVDAAENLACAYGYFLDEAHWDEAADLFAAEGWKELSYIGTFIGRERIRESMVARYGRRHRNPRFLPIHQKTQPYVSVSPDGMRAQIRLKMLQVNAGWDRDASTVLGVYEEQAVLEDGIWRIHGMDLEYIAVADWARGWAGVAPEQSRLFAPTEEQIAAFEPAPDAPLRGQAFAPFPEIRPLGFHYENPVTGRPPALLFSWSDGRFAPTP